MLIFSRDKNCSVSVVAVSAFSVLSCIPRDLLSLAAIGLVNIDMFGNTFFWYKYNINFHSFQILLLRMTQGFFLLLTLSLTCCQPDNCPGDFHLEPHQQNNTLSLNHSSTISMKIYKRFCYCCFCCRFDNKWWIWRHNEHWDVPSWRQLHHPSFSSTR